eukprot:scaffold4481_cov121-Cylindrotheca_fusiformis.AAC.9
MSARLAAKYGKVALPLGFLYFLVFMLFDCCDQDALNMPQEKVVFDPRGGNRTDETQQRHSSSTTEEIESIQRKMKPRHLEWNDDGIIDRKTFKPLQFLHLHNMKTGGTSVDRRLRCATNRLQEDPRVVISRYSIHECWRGTFRRCMSNPEDPCREKMSNATVMSFCGPLRLVDTVGWVDETNPVPSFTALRHPVDRVWSMYRFQTDNCFGCRNLTDIYEMLDKGEWPGFDTLCMSHLANKQVANLMSSTLPEDASDEEKVNSAIQTMKSFFTVIGLTEDMKATEALLVNAFPWLAQQVEGSNTTCTMEHTNKAPTNNGCIKDRKAKKVYHWYLPPHPDEATRKVIEEHNRLDLKLYEAAVEYFQLQKRAIGYKED